MKRIYIFGTGGFAREVYFLVMEINKEKNTFEVAGFLDITSDVSSIKIGKDQIPVYNEEAFFKSGKSEKACFAIGIGDSKITAKIKDKYLSSLEFPNLIHPNVRGLFETIKFGNGNIVTAGCIFTLDISVGSLNIFNLNTTIGHDVVIGDCNVINPGVNISGGVGIGNNNLIGTNAAVLQYKQIGDNNMIGAAALINSDISNSKVVVGIPGKVIKEIK